jgi:hypothetical protein
VCDLIIDYQEGAGRFQRNRSQAEGGKRAVPETHREWQEGQHFGRDDQEETWREFRYGFQPFTRPTLWPIVQAQFATGLIAAADLGKNVETVPLCVSVHRPRVTCV